MSEDIDRLQAEYEAACRARKAADEAWQNARAALNAAMADETGLVGHLVSWTDTRGWGVKRRSVYRRMVVTGLGYSRFSLRGTLIKADGTIGQREVVVSVDALTDLGPWDGKAGQS